MRPDLDYFASLDWGFNAPLACYWWLCLPDGRYHIVREWKQAGVYAEDFAQRFWTISREDLGLGRPRYVVAGGDIRNKSGIKGSKGESVYETLQSYGLPLKNADRDRKNGWYRLHELLRPSPYGTPWLTVDPSCGYLLRTLPAAPKDKDDEDEIDPKFSDDHGIESLRYGAMSRPSPTVILQQRTRGEVGTLFQEALRLQQQAGILGSTAVRRSA
jgi:hypothetical protein